MTIKSTSYAAALLASLLLPVVALAAGASAQPQARPRPRSTYP
jgi:hypothetical protein